MTLERATAEALAAARRGDLDSLTQALRERDRALAAGEQPTPGVHAAGEIAAQLLRDLIEKLHNEAARLEQFQRSLPSAAPAPTFDICA